MKCSFDLKSERSVGALPNFHSECVRVCMCLRSVSSVIICASVNVRS